MIDHPTAPDELDPSIDTSMSIRFDASDVIRLDGSEPDDGDEPVDGDESVDPDEPDDVSLVTRAEVVESSDRATSGLLSDTRERQRNELIELLFAPVASLPKPLGNPRTPLFAPNLDDEATPVSPVLRFDSRSTPATPTVHKPVVLESMSPATVTFVPAEGGGNPDLVRRMLGTVVVVGVLVAVGVGLWWAFGTADQTESIAPTPLSAVTSLPSTTEPAPSTTTPTTTLTTVSSVTTTGASTTALEATSSVATTPAPPAVSPTTVRRVATTAPRRTTTTIGATTTTDGSLVVPPSVSVEPPTRFEPSTVPPASTAPPTSTATTTTASPTSTSAATTEN